MIFNVGGFASSSLLNKQKILLDYFIVSQLVYNDKVRSLFLFYHSFFVPFLFCLS